MLTKIFNWIKTYIKDIIYVCIILVMAGLLFTAVKSCVKEKHKYENNIIAIKDTIHYYHDADDNLVATIRAFEGELKDMKLLNEKLYDKVKSLKTKGDVTNAYYVGGTIEMPPQDTAYVISHDTIAQGFSKDFAFNDEYRELEGNVSYQEDTLSVDITKEQINFDYTLAMDDKNNIYIRSENPYVKYNELTGFQVPVTKQKKWSLGPSVNFGYDPIQKKPSFSVGVSLNYGLFKW